MKTRAELVDELASWRSIDNFAAQEDVNHAREQIARLRKAITEIDSQNEPTHVCFICKRTEADSDTFLGFHQSRRANKEICDDCAWFDGCACCDMPGNHIQVFGVLIAKPVEY